MSQQTQVYTVQPVGYVRASDTEGRYEIQLLREYAAALKELEQFSHVIILWWADRCDTPAAREVLTTQLPYAPGVRAGVFACRSEYRPNPIGITVMPVLEIDPEAGIFRLPWIDALDGTPVLDLKPYLPVSDRVRSVRVAGWMQDWPEWMEDAGAYFAAHPTNFGG